MKEEILEGNKLIAEFDGWVFNKYPNLPNKAHREINGALYGISFANLNYHSSWELLMPVVEKIESIKGVQVAFYPVAMKIYVYGKIEADTRADNKIEAVWLAVVEFIKWYNKNK